MSRKLGYNDKNPKMFWNVNIRKTNDATRKRSAPWCSCAHWKTIGYPYYEVLDLSRNYKAKLYLSVINVMIIFLRLKRPLTVHCVLHRFITYGFSRWYKINIHKSVTNPEPKQGFFFFFLCESINLREINISRIYILIKIWSVTTLKINHEPRSIVIPWFTALFAEFFPLHYNHQTFI